MQECLRHVSWLVAGLLARGESSLLFLKLLSDLSLLLLHLSGVLLLSLLLLLLVPGEVGGLLTDHLVGGALVANYLGLLVDVLPGLSFVASLVVVTFFVLLFGVYNIILLLCLLIINFASRSLLKAGSKSFVGVHDGVEPLGEVDEVVGV